MALPNVSPAEAEHIAEVIAKAADQYLISYIILARFEECGPHSVAFTMAHCLELSIKAAYWQTKKAAPKGDHRVDQLIESLRPGLGDELEKHLPDPATREKFKNRVDAMNVAAPMDMLEWFFDVNPNFDDDRWMVLYALFRPMHIKYGVDKRPAILRLMLPERLKLNKMGLRLIGCARKEFPNKESHREELRKFVKRLPKRRTIIDALDELLRTGAAYFNPEDEKGMGPFPRLTFDAEELNLLKETLSLK